MLSYGLWNEDQITGYKLYLTKFYSPYQQLALLYQNSHAKNGFKWGLEALVLLEVTREKH